VAPITENIRGEITQWDIWDTYVEEFRREAKEEEKGGGSAGAVVRKGRTETGEGRYSASFLRSMKIMERMIRQNEEDARYRDYRYYWQ
jgi:dynein intermediate chain 1